MGTKKSKIMKKILTLILFVSWILSMMFIMVSCDPVKRHQRLVEKFPHVHKNDTIVQRDTIRTTIQRVQHDTIVHIDILRDTLFIDRDRLRVQIVRFNDSIFVDAECDSIFIEKIIERKIPIVHFPLKCEFDKWFDRLKWFGLLFVLLLIIFFMKNVLTNKK